MLSADERSHARTEFQTLLKRYERWQEAKAYCLQHPDAEDYADADAACDRRMRLFGETQAALVEWLDADLGEWDDLFKAVLDAEEARKERTRAYSA